MDHSQVLELLTDYLDQTLDPVTHGQLEQHLATCLSCRREYIAFENALRAVGSLHRMTAPEDFVERVQKTIRKRSRGRFFAGRASLLNRVPYELFSLLLLAVLLALYLIVQLTPTRNLRDALPGPKTRPLIEGQPGR
jgi:anti-sigma factor RsiW